MTTERLQKVMAHRGICSRRKAEEFIAAGKVRVNGQKVTGPGLKVEKDVKITVEGVDVDNQVSEKLVYILLHKPIGYITSSSSDQGESVLDLITKEEYISSGFKAETAWEQVKNARLYPVGRLDKDSEGLVLLTNDGTLANKLTHPRYGHDKEYEVTITGRVPRGAEKVLKEGMYIGDGDYAKGVTIKKISNRGKRTIVTVVLREGKNRQIRRMFGRLEMNVVSLKRTRFSTYNLNTLPVGKWILIHK